MSTKIRIILVDDHAMLRRGLRQALAQQERLEVVGEASGGAQALALADQLHPELVLMDVHLPDSNGIEVSRQLLARHPSIKVLIFSSDSARRLVDEALQIGVCGYLSKSGSLDELLTAIDSVMEGKLYLSPEMSGEILSDYRRSLHGGLVAARPEISEREKQLLRLVAEGRRNKEISAELKLSTKSVEAYRSRLMKRLNCASSAELVRYAIREGIAKL
jgi:DNA-binding NarL/FixJ family response regulator